MATARTRSLAARIAGIAGFLALCLGTSPPGVAAAPGAFDAWPTMGSPGQRTPPKLLPSAKGSASANTQTRRRKKRQRTSLDYSQCPTPCRCNFFLWNAGSYFKHQHTLNQVNQFTFEGLGGKRFVCKDISSPLNIAHNVRTVHIQPNTILERWYFQYKRGELKTDACVLCGHSWSDHLEYWWFRRRKGKHSAFDDFVEDCGDADESDKKTFYRRYVEVLTNKQRRRRRCKGWEVRESFTGDVSYAVPSFDPEADGRPKGFGSVLLLALTRAASLERVDDLMWLGKVDALKSKQEL